jgi:hypothetical protein
MTKLSDTQRVILSNAAQHEVLLVAPPAKLPAAARNAVLRSLLAKTMLEEIAAPREFVGLGWRQDEDGAWIALRITNVGLQAIGLDAADALPDDRGPAMDQQTASTETAILPTESKGDSPAAFPPAPPSPSGEAPEGAQRAPVSRHGPIGGAAALRMAATTVLEAWGAPRGLDDAISGLRDALAAAPRASGPTRDPAAPRQPRTGTKQEAVLAMLSRDEGATIAQVMDATGWQQHTVRGFLAGLKRKGITVEVLERVRQVGPDKQGAKGSYSIYRTATAASAEVG